MFSSTWYNFLGSSPIPIRTAAEALSGSPGTLAGGYTGLAQGTNLSQYQQALMSGSYTGTGMRGSPLRVSPQGSPTMPTMPTHAAPVIPQQYRPAAAAAPMAQAQQAAPTAQNPFDYLASQFVQPGQSMVMSQKQLSGWLQNPVVQKMLKNYFASQQPSAGG